MSPTLIHINLSSENDLKRKKRPQQTKASNAIGIIASVIILLMASFYIYATLKAHKTKQLKSNYKNIETKFAEAQKLQELYDKLNVKYNALKECKVRSLNLSEKWIELAKLTPNDIYITEISITPDDNNADSQNMTINARATGAVGESVVLLFLDKLKKCAAYTNTFNDITLSAVYSDNDEKVFSIILKKNNKK